MAGPSASRSSVAAARRLEPRVTVLGDAGGGDRLGDALALRGRDPRRGAAPGRGQQLAGEDEQRPPHRQLLDDLAVVVQGGVDVLRA